MKFKYCGGSFTQAPAADTFFTSELCKMLYFFKTPLYDLWKDEYNLLYTMLNNKL